MAKKNHKAGPVMRSPEESNSNSSSSSSDGEALPPTPKLAAAGKESADAKTVCSGSDSDVFERPLKSMRSKLMDDGSKLKRPVSRPNSKPAVSSMKTPTKRQDAAAEEKNGKKSKTGKGAWVRKEEEDRKSVLFQRIWSDEDEVALLEGMIEYKEKKGVYPIMDANGFYDFIKNSVKINVDKKQVVQKVWALRKRYLNRFYKKKDPNTPHEKKITDLSKKIWGEPVMEMYHPDFQEIESNTNGAQNGVTESPSRSTSPGNSGEGDKLENSLQFLGKASLSLGFSETIVKAGLESCSEDKKAELENKWRKLHLEESDLLLRKLDLTRQETEMIIESFKSGRK